MHHDHIHLHLQITTTIPGIQPNVRDFEGDTALSHACCCGSLGVAKLLVAKKSGLVAGDDSLGEVGHLEVLSPEVKVNLGGDVNHQDSDNMSTADMDHVSDEVSDGHTDINTGDLDGVTPLHKAIANNWGGIVDLLLDQPHLKVTLPSSPSTVEPDQVNQANKYGFTALILAAGMGNLDIVSKLTPRSEVNVNCVEGNLCSALMIACMHGYLRIADLLLQVTF